MKKPIHIDSSKLSNNIEKYIKPEVVYIPLENKNGITYKHLVKEGDYIYKGQVIAVNEKINFPIHSSVSGYAVCGSKHIISNGKKIKCVIIENDFKEKGECHYIQFEIRGKSAYKSRCNSSLQKKQWNDTENKKRQYRANQ